MGYFEAFILGIIQGITEFLPLSRDAHFIIIESITKKSFNSIPFISMFLNIASIFSIIFYFHSKILLLLKASLGIFFHRYRIIYYHNKNFLWGLITASIPATIIWIGLKPVVEEYFSFSGYIGYAMIVTSIILYISDSKTKKDNFTPTKALFTGMVQGISVMPGISFLLSAPTAILCGIERNVAAEFSILLTIPILSLSAFIDFKTTYASTIVEDIAPYIISSSTAFLAGIFAIYIFMYTIKTSQLKNFALYLLIIGIITSIWL